MSRNDFIKKIKKILGNPNLSDDEKSQMIFELCQKEEQGYGGMPLRKLLKQIEKETGCSLQDTVLYNELGGISKKSESIYSNTNNTDGNNNDDDDDNDGLPPNAPMPSPVS